MTKIDLQNALSKLGLALSKPARRNAWMDVGREIDALQRQYGVDDNQEGVTNDDRRAYREAVDEAIGDANVSKTALRAAARMYRARDEVAAALEDGRLPDDVSTPMRVLVCISPSNSGPGDTPIDTTQTKPGQWHNDMNAIAQMDNNEDRLHALRLMLGVASRQHMNAEIVSDDEIRVNQEAPFNFGRDAWVFEVRVKRVPKKDWPLSEGSPSNPPADTDWDAIAAMFDNAWEVTNNG